MTEKSLAKQEQAMLAERKTPLTPVEVLGQEIALRPEGDEDYRFAMRKLGNIHLGVREVKADGSKGLPKATEYFVLPDVLKSDESFRAALIEIGENPDCPQKLPIVLMSNNLETNLYMSRDLYGMDGRLKCRLTIKKIGKELVGECMRLNTTTWNYEPHDCNESTCEYAQKKQCTWKHRLRFLLPDAHRIGYWQIVTPSNNNRGGLMREMADIRLSRHGGLAGIDLLLIMTNERVFHKRVVDKNGRASIIPTNPYLLHIDAPGTMRELQKAQGTDAVYDADVIEVSYEKDDDEHEPVADSDDFEVGEQPIDADPATGEVIEAEPVDDELESQRSRCIDRASTLELKPFQIKNFCIQASKPSNKTDVFDLDAAECQRFSDLLQDYDIKHNQV